MEQREGVKQGRAGRVLICPNAFKGSLTAMQAAQAMSEGVQRAAPWFRVDCVPLADGGDGILETLVGATGGTLYTAQVTGPLGTPVTARWGRLGGVNHEVGVIEMAEASGLRLLRPEQRDCLRATTRGTGELMLRAWESGCRTLLVGIGGSATTDGGAGMAQALGTRLRDARGQELEPGGAALASLATIDRSGWLLPDDVTVRVACDVDNPLCGPQGAAAIYGPQKGATPEQVALLDTALSRYADVLARDFHADARNVPGAGAAGGLGLGLLAFCHAALSPGIDMVFEATDFDTRLAQADWLLTGEGKLDGQTARGKAIAGVARKAKAAGKPVIALAGMVEREAEASLREEGLTVAFSTMHGPLALEQAMQQAYVLLSDAAERVTRLFVRDWT